MKIKWAASDPEAKRCTIGLEDVQENVIAVAAKTGADLVVLFESRTGAASARVVAGLRQMADDLEKGLKADVSPIPGPTQPMGMA